MRRRQFIMAGSAAVAVAGLGLTGCTTTSPSSSASDAANAGKRNTINAGIDSTLARLYENVAGSRELVASANGVLVFPSVIAAGFWVGGQYGEGALRVGGRTVGYFSTLAGSFGLQIGAQSKALVFLFMTQQALDEFTRSQGWAVGANATVAVLKVGANGAVDSSTATGPVQAFVLTNGGLMAGVSLEGTKVSRLII
jgi:lipid-binding SYLF domain-containing protein